MDTQLKELLDTIKAEGVESAEQQATQIVAEAEEKAQQITADARSRAAEIVEEAKRDRTRQEAAGKEAVGQAARDLVLNVQAQLTAIFRKVVEQALDEAFDAGVLERAVEVVVNAWATGKDETVDVLLSAGDLEKLEGSLRKRLADRVASGTEIRAAQGVQAGFRVATRDGGVYYDFTAEAIAEGLCAYVTPRLAETVKEAAASVARDA